MNWWPLVPTWAQVLIVVMAMPYALMVLALYAMLIDRVLDACDRRICGVASRVRRWRTGSVRPWT